MNKKLIIAGIFTVFALYGCGNDMPVPDDTIVPDDGKPVYYQSEDETEAVTEQPQADNDEIKLEVESDSEKVSFRLADGPGLIERYNDYTGEVSYSFRVESVKLKVEEQEYYENQYKINVSLTGEKVFDCKGDEAERGFRYIARILDSNGVVIDSENYFGKSLLKTGDRLEDSELDLSFSFLELEPDEYTVDIFQQPESYVKLAEENTEYLNPERWYSIIVYTNEESAGGYNFDARAPWVYQYAMRNIYIDDNLILHNVFSEPYDLKQAECTHRESYNTPVADKYYCDYWYYDITDFDELLSGVPDEAVPSDIRVSYSPGGDIIAGERPAITIAFIYRKNAEETNPASIAFYSMRGANLTQKEWDMILATAEKSGIDTSQLAVIQE